MSGPAMNKEAASKIADRYIAKDGGEPEIPDVPPIRPIAAGGDRMDATVALLFFIGGHKPSDVYNSRRATEAMAALSVLTGLPVEELCRAVDWDKP